MAQQVDVKGVGLVEFPDGMPKESMLQALRRKFSNAGKRTIGAAEGLASIASSAIAEPVSGLAGIAGAALTQDSGKATDWINATQDALTYQPRTETGQARLQDAARALAPVGEIIQGASQNLGDKTYNATNSPMLAALAYSAPTAMLEGLGVKGLRTASRPVSGADLYSARMGMGSVNPDKILNFRRPDFELDPSELSDVGADVNDGFVTLYHRTTPEQASSIKGSGKFQTKEDGVFFSTSLDGQAKDYGDGVIKVKVPISMLQLDDIFDNEAHVRIPMKKTGSIDLKPFIVDESAKR